MRAAQPLPASRRSSEERCVVRFMDRPQYTKLREIVGGHNRPPLQLLRSEDQFHSELNYAIVAGLQSAVAADIAGDLPEVGRIVRQGTAEAVRACATGSDEIQVVGKVEGFR